MEVRQSQQHTRLAAWFLPIVLSVRGGGVNAVLLRAWVQGESQTLQLYSEYSRACWNRSIRTSVAVVPCAHCTAFEHGSFRLSLRGGQGSSFLTSGKEKVHRLVLDILVSFVGDCATQLLYTPQLIFIVDRYSKQWQKDRVSGTIMYSRSCLFVYSMRKHVPYALIESQIRLLSLIQTSQFCSAVLW